MDYKEFFTKFALFFESTNSHMIKELVAHGRMSKGYDWVLTGLKDEIKGKNLSLEIRKYKVLSDGSMKVLVYLTEDRLQLVFTLVQSNGSWKASHIEGILFPLFNIPNTPYSNILKLDEKIRKWTAAEIELAFISKVYFTLNEKHGKEYAQHFFSDGAGYKIAMAAWLPFIEGPAQYVLYTAILEENLRGSKCIVSEASENRGVLVMEPMAHLEIIKRAIFYPQFSIDEYRELYKSITRDRAINLNYTIDVEFDGTLTRARATK